MKIFSPQIIGTLEVDGNSTLTGSAIITGSLDVTGSLNVTEFLTTKTSLNLQGSPSIATVTLSNPTGSGALIISQNDAGPQTLTLDRFSTLTATTTSTNITGFNNITLIGRVSASSFTGSLQGTASFATTASFFSLASVAQNAVFSGSIRGEVNALSIASNTASLDCALDNFFTLQLVSGSDTFINPSNILSGQTINLRVSTTGSGTVSFPSSVKQVSGSLYVPTTTTSTDIVTFISFDSSSLFLSNVKNLI